MKERVLMSRWVGGEWEEYADCELHLEEWELNKVFTTEYKVIEREKESE